MSRYLSINVWARSKQVISKSSAKQKLDLILTSNSTAIELIETNVLFVFTLLLHHRAVFITLKFKALYLYVTCTCGAADACNIKMSTEKLLRPLISTGNYKRAYNSILLVIQFRINVYCWIKLLVRFSQYVLLWCY